MKKTLPQRMTIKPKLSIRKHIVSRVLCAGSLSLTHPFHHLNRNPARFDGTRAEECRLDPPLSTSTTSTTSHPEKPFTPSSPYVPLSRQSRGSSSSRQPTGVSRLALIRLESGLTLATVVEKEVARSSNKAWSAQAGKTKALSPSSPVCPRRPQSPSPSRPGPYP